MPHNKKNKHIIMIVDDAPEIIKLLQRSLAFNYTVIPITNGYDAIKQAMAKPQPDLILLDVAMPDIDGYEVCRQLKINVATQHIPIIFITAMSKHADEVHGLNLGAVDYITKPFNVPIVRTRVATQLKLKMAYQELHEAKQKLLERKTDPLQQSHAPLVEHDEASATPSTEYVTVTHDDLTKIKLAEIMLKNLNILLEQRVQQRTRELECSNQDLQQFAYVASHDLQEPLRQVSSFAQLLKRRYQDQLDDKANQFIDYMVEGCQRMVGLIDSLLHYSRIGTNVIEPQPIAGEEIVQRARANLLTTIRETHAMITCDPLPVLWGDFQQLVQLLQNLLSNAIKFCQPNQIPQIHISAESQESQVVVTVRDNGIGIESQHMQRIFVIFQRLHSRAAFAGTGIGLAVCKRIVERHNGRIWVTSELNQGSTFFFSLPSPKSPDGTVG